MLDPREQELGAPLGSTQYQLTEHHILTNEEKCGTAPVWQNRLNYFGSSAPVIAIQPVTTQRTSNGTTHWSVGSPPDETTVQQDRSRFTSREGEFTVTVQLINL
jgi:hypothetical protein